MKQRQTGISRVSDKRRAAAVRAGSTFTKPSAGLQRKAGSRKGLRQDKPQAHTGPDRKTRAAVLERDQCQCCACGKSVGLPGTWWSIQHRVARGQGGTNELPNLVTLCGSATSPGCHRLAEDRGAKMHTRGFWLRSGEDPALVPIMLASEFGSDITVWLTRDGEYSAEAPEGVSV